MRLVIFLSLIFLFCEYASMAQVAPEADGKALETKADSTRSSKKKKGSDAEPPPIISAKRNYDTDKDGLKDFEDDCPAEKGLKNRKGCPDPEDYDNDGVANLNDECPYVVGDINHHGCPKPLDVDEDGVPDRLDNCVNVPGVPENNGCPPDQDQDGIYDKADHCPNLAGIASNMGCPEVSTTDQEKIEEIAKAVNFATGSSKLLKSSIVKLAELSTMLKDHPEWKMEVNGHTDSSGDHDKNVALSAARAEATAQQLVDQGIAKERLMVKGFGPDLPIATNKTAEGRAKNRRVELKIVF